MIINNKIKYALSALFVVVLLVFVLNFFNDSTKIVTSEFIGNLVEVGDNHLVLDGIYVVDKTVLETPQDIIEVEVILTQTTKITRIAISIPNTRDIFKVADLPREESEATLDFLREDSAGNIIGVEVISNQNIFNRTQFEAVEIIYRVPIFNNRVPPLPIPNDIP